MMRRTVITFAAAALVGCASDPYQNEMTAYRQGNYRAAEAGWTGKAKAGDDDALALLGSLYYDKLGQRQRGLSMLNLAARRGNHMAQQALLEIGQPIPSADLREASGTGLAMCSPGPGGSTNCVTF